MCSRASHDPQYTTSSAVRDACSTVCPSHDFIFSSVDRLLFFCGLSRSENGEKTQTCRSFFVWEGCGASWKIGWNIWKFRDFEREIGRLRYRIETETKKKIEQVNFITLFRPNLQKAALKELSLDFMSERRQVPCNSVKYILGVYRLRLSCTCQVGWKRHRYAAYPTRLE